jgi:hypothetical protein
MHPHARAGISETPQERQERQGQGPGQRVRLYAWVTAEDGSAVETSKKRVIVDAPGVRGAGLRAYRSLTEPTLQARLPWRR